MNVILIDNKLDLAKKHAATLDPNVHTVWYWDVNEAYRWDGSKFSGPAIAPSTYDLALVHLGDVQAIDNAAKDCPRVVIYSNGGNAKHDNYPCIKSPVGVDSPIPAEALRRICLWVGGNISDNEWRKRIEELFNDEPLLAFRLLCEATMTCAGEPGLTNAFDTGLTIHAPQALGEWLKPFGEYDNEKKSERIEEVASLIASEPVRSKVLDVFTEVGKADLLEKIGCFERALAEERRKSPNMETPS